MISYRLLKDHAGILLLGDYWSLRKLHEIIHDVNNRSPLIQDQEGWFINLAYDVRKAYEGEREVIEQSKDFGDVGGLYGVKILWPVLLVQQRILRASLAYIDHSKHHQAVTYALEAVIEEAIAEDFGSQSAAIQERWLRLDPASRGLEDKLNSRGAIFCSWKKTQRKNEFSYLLDSFDPMYSTILRSRIQNGEASLLTQEVFDEWGKVEWPDPNW